MSWPAQPVTRIMCGYYHHVCPLPPSSNKYVQQQDNAWAMLTGERGRTATEARDERVTTLHAYTLLPCCSPHNALYSPSLSEK